MGTNHDPENRLILDLLGSAGVPGGGPSRRGRQALDELDWAHLGSRLERHGLTARFLERTAIDTKQIPGPAARQLEEVAGTAAAMSKACQLTLYRLLKAAAHTGLETLLLKGCALVETTYGGSFERPMGDVDVLVRARDLHRALRVAAEAGFRPRDQLPVFFHRFLHFHVAVDPCMDGLAPVEIHWRLHSPALLVASRVADLWRRRQRIEVYGFPTAVLHPLHGWLHLATHLWSHWNVPPFAVTDEDLLNLLEDPCPHVALKWIVDLVETFEQLSASTPPDALARWAAAWCAAPQAAATIAFLRGRLSTRGEGFARDVLELLTTSPMASRPAARPAPREPAWPRLARLGALAHFRMEVLRLVPRWIFPPAAYLRGALDIDSTGLEGQVVLAVARAVHAARVLVTIGLGVPVALAAYLARAARPLLRRRSRSRTGELLEAARYVRDLEEFEPRFAAHLAMTACEDRQRRPTKTLLR